MASKEKHQIKKHAEIQTVPFENAEELWFWFIQAQKAKEDGARFVAGQGLQPRPCEPIDVLKILDRLYRQRRLLRDHLLVLRHYGRRQMVPDQRRVKERRAYEVWKQALERLSVPLERKGIIRAQPDQGDVFWKNVSSLLEGMAAE